MQDVSTIPGTDVLTGPCFDSNARAPHSRRESSTAPSASPIHILIRIKTHDINGTADA